MINFNIHNVTSVEGARVSDSNDGSGWLTITLGAAFGPERRDGGQPTITSEITLFFKNKDQTLTDLQDQITLAIAQNRRDMLAAKAEKEEEEAEANG